MREIDAKYKSPKQRAEVVHRILQTHRDLTNWDSLCFAVEFMAYQAADPHMSWLESSAREAARLLYTMHYEFAEQLYAGSTVETEAEKEKELQDAYGLSTDGKGNYVLKIPAKLFLRIFGPAPDPQVDGKHLVCGYFETMWPSQIERLEYRRVQNDRDDEFWITIYKRQNNAALAAGSGAGDDSLTPDGGQGSSSVDSGKREPDNSAGAIQHGSGESQGHLDSPS